MINNHMARPIEEHTEVCYTCKGEGEIKCFACNGMGGILLPGDYDDIKCKNCEGTGNLKCGDCDGKGEIWYRS